MDKNLILSLARLRNQRNNTSSTSPRSLLNETEIANQVAAETNAQAQRDIDILASRGNDYYNLNTLGKINLPASRISLNSTISDTRPTKSLSNIQRLGYKIKNGLNTGLTAVGNFIKDNALDVAEAFVNLGGNLGASLINRKAINDLEYVNAPTPLRAAKLKTRVNIHPQLDNIRETVSSYEDDITRNTGSSKTALANRQLMRARGVNAANQLYGQKENLETELINQDRLNQQNVGNQNVQLFNNWIEGLANFKNQKRQMQAENSVAGINNAAEALSNLIGGVRQNQQINLQKRRDMLSAAIMALSNPNAAKVLNDENLLNKYKKVIEGLYNG